jgi:hypothetical protein
MLVLHFVSGEDNNVYHYDNQKEKATKVKHEPETPHSILIVTLRAKDSKPRPLDIVIKKEKLCPLFAKLNLNNF